MSKIRVRWPHVWVLTTVLGGALAACGRASKDPTPGGGAGSGARGGMPGASASAGVVTDGGQHATSGGTDSAEGGEGGGIQITGGTAGSAGGAVHGGTSGADAGDGGSETGAAGAGASSGGGKGTVVEPYFHAGARLKPRVYRVGDLEVLDSVTEQSWYDMETRVWCNFSVGSDGVERCFPDNVWSDESLIYLDAACTRPALRNRDPGCGASDYLMMEPDSACSQRTYRIGVARPYDTPIYVKREGSCQRGSAGTAQDSVSPLEEVPPETFVAVKRVSRPRHADMNALVREGDDGSSEIVGFSEPGHEAPCFGLGLDVSSQVCVPSWGRIGEIFGDADCTQPMGHDLRDPCTGRTNTVLLQVTADAQSCEPAQAIDGLWRSAGKRLAPVFAITQGVCAMSSTEQQSVEVPGAPIDLASLPTLDLIEVGDSPLKLVFYGFGGVPFLPASRRLDAGLSVGRFIEAASGESCWPVWFEDGTWRCVPPSFPVVGDFELHHESEDCTGPPLYPALEPRSCVGKQPELRGLVVQRLTGATCMIPAVQALEFGEKFRPSSLSHGSPICQTTRVSDGSSVFRLNEVDPAQLFVPMERTLQD